jgi:hypothetical protein
MIEFAGDRMTFREDENGNAHLTFDNVGTGRTCSDCRLCCKLVPVPQISKPAGVRCRYSRAGKGCTVYDRRPNSCRAWSCRWLADPATAGMPRPDRCHYVIDLEYDHVDMHNNAGGPDRIVTVLQVWVDPAFPDAHHAHELRAYLHRMAEKYGVAAIIRWSSTKAVVLFPPPISSDGKWHQQDGTIEARDKLEQKVLADARRAG